MYFMSIRKKEEMKIDPNNIFIYIFIFVKFSFNHSLDRQVKTTSTSCESKVPPCPLDEHDWKYPWSNYPRFEMADGFSALHVKDTIYIEQIMFDISTLAPNSLPTQYRKSSWHRSLKIHTQLLNFFPPLFSYTKDVYVYESVETRLLSISSFFLVIHQCDKYLLCLIDFDGKFHVCVWISRFERFTKRLSCGVTNLWLLFCNYTVHHNSMLSRIPSPNSITSTYRRLYNDNGKRKL